MGTIERLTITLPADMAGLVKGAVNEGGYASTSEVIREALREWKMKRDLHVGQLAALRVDIDRGLADVANGRLVPYDRERILERGRKQFASRANSALPRPRKHPKPLRPDFCRVLSPGFARHWHCRFPVRLVLTLRPICA
jgi:antitoxin ParD1/3/4